MSSTQNLYDKRKFQAVLPAPGWRVLCCVWEEESSSGSADEVPVIGFAAFSTEDNLEDRVEENAVLALVIWDDEHQCGLTLDDSLIQAENAHFLVLPPTLELTDSLKSEGIDLAKRKKEEANAYRKHTKETVDKINAALLAVHPARLTRKGLIERGVSRDMYGAVSALRICKLIDGDVIHDPIHGAGTVGFTNKGLERARAAAQETAVSGG
jgi:hypothetical protein